MAGETRNQTSSIQANDAIGNVAVVKGTVQAQAPDGTIRPLHENSPIFANDRILTGDNGAISIVFGDAAQAQIDLGRNSDVLIDEDVYQPATPDILSETTAEVEQIQEALLEGDFDPTLDLEAAAAGQDAGPASAGGGIQNVRFELTGDEVVPESGAETTGPGFNFVATDLDQFIEPEEPILTEVIAEEIIEEGLPATEPIVEVVTEPTSESIPPSVEPPGDETPSTTTSQFSFFLDEKNLLNGTSPDSEQLTSDGKLIYTGNLADLGVEFGDNGLGSINFGTDSLSIDGNGDAITITGAHGQLIINDNGTWTYTVVDPGDGSSNLDHPVSGVSGTATAGSGDSLQDVFTFTATYSNGDTVEGSLTANIYDDAPLQADGVEQKIVEEEALDGGNQEISDAEPDVSVTSGDLTSLVLSGADTSGTFSIIETTDLPGLLSKGEEVSYAFSENAGSDTLTAYVPAQGDLPAREVFTLEVEENGQYTFTLLDQLDHQATLSGEAAENTSLLLSNGSTVDSIQLGNIIVFTDSDGDFVTLRTDQVAFTVVDDIPVSELQPTAIVGSVQEDGMSLATSDSSEGNREPGDSTADDEDSGATAATGLAALFTAGADDPLSFGLTTDQAILDALDPLSSGGDALSFSSDGTTLTATADDGTGERDVFTLQVNSDGTWEFDLIDQLDHVDDGANDENWALQGSNAANGGIDFSSVVTATDSDGDTITGAEAETFTVRVQDDVPISELQPTAIVGSVQEDGMSLATSDSSEGNREPGDSTADDEDSGATAATGLAALFTAGADDPLSFGLTTDQAILDALDPLSSGGDALSFSSDGTTLTATADDGTGERDVFTLQVNSDGTWEFDLIDQLDHVDDGANDENWALQGSNAANGGIDFSSVVTATDSDGDTITGAEAETFTVRVQDDIPISELQPTAIVGSVQEDGMSLATSDSSEGNREPGDSTADDEDSGATAATGLAALFTAGADDPLSFGLTTDQAILDALDPLSSGGDALSFSSDGTTLTATADDGTGARDVFTLQVNSDGTWEFDLIDQLDHVDDGANDENWALQGSNAANGGIDFSSVVTATDSDGDTITGAEAETFTVRVQDDIPVSELQPTAIVGSVQEDGMSLATSDSSEGNREPGDSTADDEDSGATAATGLAALFTAGADDPLSFGLTTDQAILDALDPLSSGGDALSFSSDGTTLTATADDGTGARDVFTLQVNSDGTWEFDLIDQLDHVDDGANDENWALQGSNAANGGIDFSSVVTATDSDGDTITGAEAETFTVRVQDDIPVSELQPTAIVGSVQEDGMSLATSDSSEGNREPGDSTADDEDSGATAATGLAALFTAGADDPLSFGLTTDQAILDALDPLSSGGDALSFSSDGTTLTATADDGTGERDVFTLQVNSDGTWEFDLIDQLDHVDDGANDENWALQGSNAANGGIDFSSVVTATDSDGDTITGAEAETFTVRVQDDVPISELQPTAIVGSVQEDGMSLATSDSSEGNREPGDSTADDEDSGATAATGLAALFTAGADDPLSFGLTTDQAILDALDPLSSGGDALSFSSDGTTLTATADDGTGARDVFTLQVNSDGTWEFDLIDQLDHVDDGANDENWALQGSNAANGGIDFSSVVTATDSDGDTITGAEAETFTVRVQDDIPVSELQPTAIVGSVQEDGMSLATSDSSEGNREPGDSTADDEDSGATAATGLAALFTAGADDPLSFGLTTDQAILDALDPLSSGGDALSFSSDGTTLTATADDGTGARDVFTLQVNSDGTWEFDLIDQLDHVDDGANDENWALQGSNAANGGIDFSSVVTATDSDGDTITGAEAETFTVRVQDDVPVAAVPEQLPTNMNLVLVLDNSGSMHDSNNTANWEGNEILRSEALRFAIGTLLTGLATDAQANDTYKIHIVEYNSTAQSTATITITGDTEEARLESLNGIVDANGQLIGLEEPSSGRYTNYEAGYQQALSWVESSDPLNANDVPGELVNQVLFFSDGSPNRYNDPDYDGSHHTAGTGTNAAAQNAALAEVLGFDANGAASNEIEAFASQGYEVHAIGLDVSEAQDDVLDQLDVSGNAINIVNYTNLKTVLPELLSVTQPIIQATVEEDDLNSSDNSDPNSPDNVDGNNEDLSSSADESQGATGSLGALFVSGADEELTFSLADSGTLATLYSGGEALQYDFSSANTLVATAGGQTIFTFTVAADGSWSFDLDGNLDHAAGNAENYLLLTSPDGTTTEAGIDLSSIIRATDADGDEIPVAPGAFVIRVQDDVPVFDEVSNAYMANEPATILTGSIVMDSGADEEITVDLSSNIGPSGYFSGGKPVHYIVDPANSYVLLGVTDPDTAEQTTVLSLEIDPKNDEYEINLIQQLDTIKTYGFDSGNLTDSTTNVSQITVVQDPVTGGFIPFTPDQVLPEGADVALTLTGKNFNGNPIDVNGSTSGIGTGGDNVVNDLQRGSNPDGETLVIDFGENGLDGTLAIGPITIGGNSLAGASKDLIINYTAYNESDDPVDINGQVIIDNSPTGTAIFPGGDDFQFTFNDPAIDPAGIDAISKIELVAVAEDFKFTEIGFSVASSEVDILEEFEVTITDADGDSVTETISVEFDGNNTMIGTEENDVFVGGPEAETIIGGEGNDIIYGGDGDDVIFGNEGDDELHGEAGDDQVIGGTGQDVLSGGAGDDVLIGDDVAFNVVDNPTDDVIINDVTIDTINGGANNTVPGSVTDPGPGDTGGQSETSSDAFTDIESGPEYDIDNLIPPPTDTI